MTNPKIYNPEEYLIETQEGKKLFDIKWIYEYTGDGEIYWHRHFDICFNATLGKETIDTYSTGESRGNSPSYSRLGAV